MSSSKTKSSTKSKSKTLVSLEPEEESASTMGLGLGLGLQAQKQQQQQQQQQKKAKRTVGDSRTSLDQHRTYAPNESDSDDGDDVTMDTCPGAVHVPGRGGGGSSRRGVDDVDPGDAPPAPDASNTEEDPNSNHQLGPSGEYIAVAQTVTEPPIVTGVDTTDEKQAILDAVMQGTEQGVARERKRMNRNMLLFVLAVIVIVGIAVGITIPLVSKHSSGTTQITEISIFNTVYEIESTTELDLAGSSLSGSVPSELFLLTALAVLDLSDNTLTGPLPSELASLRSLTQLEISNNKLTGQIPSEYGALTQLSKLSLHGNEGLTGPVPEEFSLLINLLTLLLYDTNISGSIPPSLCTQKGSALLDYQIDCSNILCDCCASPDGQACKREIEIPPPVSTSLPTPNPTALASVPPATPNPTVLPSGTPPPTPDPNAPSFILDRNQYIQGQYIQASFSEPSLLTRYDDVLVFPAETTDYANTPSVKSKTFGSRANEDGVTTMRINFVETGMFKLVLRSDNDDESILAVSLPFTVVESSATLSLDEGTYIHGQWVRLTFSEASQLDRYDDILIFPTDETDFEFSQPVKTVLFGSDFGEGISNFRADFVETGSFKVIVRLDATDDVIVGESEPFTIVESTATLSLDMQTYIQGQTMRLTFSETSQLTRYDDVLIFPFDVTDYKFTVPAKSVWFGSNFEEGRSEVRVDFLETGSFKVIVRLDNADVVVGESDAFTVAESTATLSVDSPEYFHGEMMRLTFVGEVSQLNRYDDVLIFPAEVTDFNLFEPVKTVWFGTYIPDGLSELRVDFVETGSFKAVVRLDAVDLVVSESEVFSVVKSNATVTLDSGTYTHGQMLRLTFSEVSQLNRYDDVLIFPADVTDYKFTDPVKTVWFGPDYSGGFSELRVDFVENGSFKVIIRLDNVDVVVGESQIFTVIESSATVTLDSEIYDQGQLLQLTFSEVSQLNRYDDILIFPADVTDYKFTEPVKTVWFGSDYSSGVSELRVDFMDAGSFKAIVRLDGVDVIVGESPIFTVIESTATVTLESDSYLQGQTMRLRFSDGSQLNRNDDLLIFPAEVDDYKFSEPVKSVSFGSDFSEGISEMRIDFVETGRFKVIVRLDNVDVVVGESPAFAVVQSTATIALDSDTYVQGQTMRLIFSEVSQLNRFDDVLIFPSEVSDYDLSQPVKAVDFGPSAGDGVSNIPVDFSETGSFKVVVRIDRMEVVLAQSEAFAVVSS